MLNKLNIDQLEVEGKKVFLRVDFNVPLNENQEVTNDVRVRAALPTISRLLERGARLALASHLGRPKGAVVPEMSLEPVADCLSGLLGKKVGFVPECIGPEVEAAVDALTPGSVLLLENVRYHAGETKNDPEFATAMARGFEVFVNDAFGTAHRAHASNVGMAAHFERAACGYLLKKEIDYLGNAVLSPTRPFMAILGGAKVSDKIPVIENLMDKLDTLIIGGGMAYTFLLAQGHQVGRSLVEEEHLDLARKLLSRAEIRGMKVLLPVDHVVTGSFDDEAGAVTVDDVNIPADKMALDIGPKTAGRFAGELAGAGTIVWNGPMGVFEKDAFAGGTLAVARAVAGSKAVSIVGGGDSVAAVTKSGVSDSITHISTGGGASLEFLSGKELPGVAALTDA